MRLGRFKAGFKAGNDLIYGIENVLVVYLAGNFASVNRTPRSNLAAVDASVGSLTSWNPSPNSPQGVLQTHQGTSDFVFLDGHVKAVRPIQTVQMSGSQRTMWTTNDPEPLRDRWAAELLAHDEYR